MGQPEHSVLFVYDHFYPDFSAGGPVTSLTNLARLLHPDIQVSILTSGYRFGTGKLMAEVQHNQVTDWNGITIWYSENRASVLSFWKKNKADVVMLNGIFSPLYFLQCLISARARGVRIVISPRGMLQRGALKTGAWKKRLYLAALKHSGLTNSVEWHATDKQEEADIKTHFSHASITIIPNVPFQPAEPSVFRIDKKTGELRVLYYSLVAEKKNLLFLLDVLCSVKSDNISLDIIGPIKDVSYWKKCQAKMTQLPASIRVEYKGELHPNDRESVLTRYHLMALPTHGENYGHAIVEMLGCGRPVLISPFTPWSDLDDKAGMVRSLELNKWVERLNTCLLWDQTAFDLSCNAARVYYSKKVNFADLKSSYLQLFNSHKE